MSRYRISRLEHYFATRTDPEMEKRAEQELAWGIRLMFGGSRRPRQSAVAWQAEVLEMPLRKWKATRKAVLPKSDFGVSLSFFDKPEPDLEGLAEWLENSIREQ